MKKLLNLLKPLLDLPAQGGAPVPAHLSFERAQALAREPSQITDDEEAHVIGCQRCAGLLTAAQGEVAASSERRWQIVFTALRVIFLVLLPPVLCWFAARLMTSSSVSDLSSWRDREHWFLIFDLGVIALVALLSPFLHLFGWVGRLRHSLPLHLIGLFAVSFALWGYAQYEQRRISHDLNMVFHSHRWIAYDPPTYNPITGRMPTVEEIEQDLKRLRSEEKGGGGLDGLITFNAKGVFAEIPRIAKKVGFRAVIMGISVSNRDPVKPEDQIENAIAVREYVDGYCLGHNPPMTLDFKVLASWMAELRKATKKPVTTTAPLVCYLGDRGQQLRDMGDWYFPDCVAAWHLGATPKEIFEQTRQMVLRCTELPRGKPVLMKMVSFPSGGEPGMTPEAQAEFFKAVCRDLYLPSGVYISFYAAYDLPWMDHKKRPEWSRPQQHGGLFFADGRPKPAVDIVRRGFPVQTRE